MTTNRSCKTCHQNACICGRASKPKPKPSTCLSPCASTFTQEKLQAVLDALVAGNLDPIAALLAADAVFRLNLLPPIVGKDAILAFIDQGGPTSLTIRTFQLGVTASGSSFVALSVLVGTPGGDAPEIAILTLNAQCQIQAIEEVIAFAPGT